MDKGTFGRCKNCGKQIIWIKTISGKNMPVNPGFVNYVLPKQGEKAKEKIVTPSGKVITAKIAEGFNFDGYGYFSHFSTCASRKR